jgi:hypothetical protein
MLIHTHTATTSTWLYVEGVVEMSPPTPRQALKHNAAAKSNVVLLQSCGVP